jgi:hypothetical protein
VKMVRNRTDSRPKGVSDHGTIVEDPVVQKTIADNAVKAWKKARGTP